MQLIIIINVIIIIIIFNIIPVYYFSLLQRNERITKITSEKKKSVIFLLFLLPLLLSLLKLQLLLALMLCYCSGVNLKISINSTIIEYIRLFFFYDEHSDKLIASEAWSGCVTDAESINMSRIQPIKPSNNLSPSNAPPITSSIHKQ